MEVRDYLAHGADFKDLEDKEKQLKRLFFKRKPRIFPFGDSFRNLYYDRASRHASLPSKALVEALVDHYLVTIDKLYPLLDPVRIKEELRDFWNDPDKVSDPWLAQLYLILALSCYCKPLSLFEGVDDTPSALSERCLEAAETCYSKKSAFIKRTNYTDLRILCMVAIAKMVDVLPEPDIVWTFVGLVVRVAMSMHLHRNPEDFPNMPPRDAEARKKLWTTIQIMDLVSSIDSGQQMFCLPGNSDTPPPANNIILSDDGTVDTSDPNNDTIYQLRLMAAFPTMCAIVNKVNGTDPSMPYSQVLKYDDMLREALKQTESPSGMIPQGHFDATKLDWVYLQKTTVNNLLRRVLLALHQSHARYARESSVFQKSHWTILECALALLRHQRDLFENPQLAWANNFFVSDFRLAMIHVSLGIRNKHFSDQPEAGSTMSAKDLAWQALRGSYEICKKLATTSVDGFKSYSGMSVGMGVLEAIDAGVDSSSMPGIIRKSAEQAFEYVLGKLPLDRPQIDPSLVDMTLNGADLDLDSLDSGFVDSAMLSPFFSNPLDPALFENLWDSNAFDDYAFGTGDVYRDGFS